MLITCDNCGSEIQITDSSTERHDYVCDRCDHHISVSGFEATVSEWQRRLLQLDGRNNLIYFRPGRTPVHIVEHSPDSLRDALTSSRSGLTFDYAESRSRRRRADPFTAVDSDLDEAPEAYVLPGDLRGDCPPTDLQRRLGNLKRRAQEWENEQGLSVLFLALGFLKWVDQDGKEGFAPLVLLPCRLDRASPRDAFTLRLEDDDLSPNNTLSVKLMEFGITLPDPAPDLESVSVYLDSMKELIKGRPDWEVKDDIYLATFAYSKLAMWRDLDLVRNHGTDNSIVLALAGSAIEEIDATPSAEIASLQRDLSGGRMDDVLEVRDQFAVLPADYSQLLAIASARSGNNLVIHGPPGTGKSQTIANIIATFLADGKSVLFVSEKTAALDQVKRRLDDKDLGVFCLDLHSERGKKSNVYEQIRESVGGRRTVRDFDFDYAGLTERRRQLNQLVRDLHLIRQPLDRTVFQIQGRLASIQDYPHVNFDVSEIERLDQARLASIREAADRIRLRKKEFSEHWTSHWRILKSGTAPIELANKIRRDMTELATAADIAGSAAPGVGDSLGLLAPLSLREFTWLEELARNLANAPGILRSWLSDGAVDDLQSKASRESKHQAERADLIESLEAYFGTPVPDWDFDALSISLSINDEEERSLRALLGVQYGSWLVQTGEPRTSALEQLLQFTERAWVVGKEIASFLRMDAPATWSIQLDQIQIVETVGKVGPVPPGWVEPRGLDAVSDSLNRGQALQEVIKSAEGSLTSDYELGLLDVVDNEMLVRYRTDHQSSLRRIISSRYRSDRKAIRAFRKGGRQSSFEEDFSTLSKALELKRLRSNWNELESELARTLGSRYIGWNTDWDVVSEDVTAVRKLLENNSGQPRNVAGLLTEADNASQARNLGESFGVPRTELLSFLGAHLDPKIAGEFIGFPEEHSKITWESFRDHIQNAKTVTARIEAATELPLRSARKKIPDLKILISLVKSGSRLRELEHEQSGAAETLQSAFGGRFTGLDTDWSAIQDCLQWTKDLLGHVPADKLSDSFVSHIEGPHDSDYYTTISDSIALVVQNFRTQVASIVSDYDIQKSPVASLEQANFENIQQWSQDLIGDADFAGDWLLYEAAVRDLDRVVASSTTELIRTETEDSDFVPFIVERRILGAWLDSIYKDESLLMDFAAFEQEDRRIKFKELDELLIQTAQNEVRKRVFGEYPNLGPTSSRSSELGLLRGELSKTRRQLPVRRLFNRIPHLLQTIKPCFMMSPLAVSQFLPLSEDPSETLNFDLVIFDEASQVFPEDAVPAILRADQLILAGDQKQLPPTNYWRRSHDDDDDDSFDDDDTIEDPMTGRESILDVAVGLVGRVFNESHLNVHYRSKDESLIRFSNHHFYEDNLLTFPSPGTSDSWNGVHDLYVPEGRYDAGARRTNRIEAKRVVDLVFEHMRTRPIGESLGVVALSKAQADEIQRLIDERRILERDVEARFDESVEEPFFVKNLENVQGDERDRMIISIGYGPTVGSGRVPNRFGPINWAGGQRRLNVVITRAKLRVDLVHSLRATDITSRQEGPRLLRRYLEYVADPMRAFEAQVTIDDTAETESPFEEAVERALLAKGYRVARQVGVSWYRIDLAILSEDGSKPVLGIECDGKQYHSSPAARDRDWLRQQVLEGLGWSIHRVWSTAWIRNPQAELARIEAALEVAKNRSHPVDGHLMTALPPQAEHTDHHGIIEISTPVPQELDLQDYQKASLDQRPDWAELRTETTEKLLEMIVAVAKVEGSVHKDVVIDRIRECYGMGNVRGSTRTKVERAIEQALSSLVKGDGTFIWSDNTQLERMPRQPVDGNLDHVPSGELGQIVVATATLLSGAPRRDLIVEVAKRMGFNRTGSRIMDRLNSVITELLSSGRLVESFGNIRPVP